MSSYQLIILLWTHWLCYLITGGTDRLLDAKEECLQRGLAVFINIESNYYTDEFWRW